jgi:hypothetical protein
MKKKEIVTQRNVKSSHLLQKGPDTKTNWPTERRSQYNLNLNGGNKYRNLALQVGGVSKIETINYAHEPRGTQI